MGKAKLNILLDEFRGRIVGDSKYYATQRFGQEVISNYPLHRDPEKTTSRQRANSDAFGLASQQCKTEMNDPERLAYWKERYEAYKAAAKMKLSKANLQFFGERDGVPLIPADKYYKTLRGFIIGQLRLHTEG